MKMDIHQQMMTEVLETMPREFTSHDFTLACKKKGLPKVYFQNSKLRNFLNSKAAPISLKTWEKDRAETESPIVERIENAIALLKSQGFRILKPVSEFVEI